MKVWVWMLTGLGSGLLLGCGPEMQSSVTYVPPSNPLPSAQSRLVEPAPTESNPLAQPTPVVEGNTVPEPIEAATTDPAKPATDPFPLKLVRGNPKTKKIALTFDDGPHEAFTDELLRILHEFGVPATFFLIGRNVDAHPELVRMAQDAGIELANHTYNHFRLPTLSDYEVKVELERGADAISKVTGNRPRYFRPPGGEYDERTLKICRELQMTMVLWTADAGDFTTALGNPSPDAIMQKVLRYASPGGIIIMHDPMPSSLKALPAIITSLRALGYEFVTVSQLAADPSAITTGGPRIKHSSKATVQSFTDQARYPSPNSEEAKNASPQQRITNQTSPQGTKDQRIDPGVQGQQNHEGQVAGTGKGR